MIAATLAVPTFRDIIAEAPMLRRVVTPDANCRWLAAIVNATGVNVQVARLEWSIRCIDRNLEILEGLLPVEASVLCMISDLRASAAMKLQ